MPKAIADKLRDLRRREISPLKHLTRFPEGNDYLYCFWGMGFNIYRIPPDLTQLEKEVEL